MTNRIPDSPRWDTAIERAFEFLLQNNIKTLPVDIESLYCSNRWALCSCAEAREHTGIMHPLGKTEDKVDAKTLYDGKYYLTIYNERFPMPRIRFTLLHEVGHIVLNHLCYDQTLVCNGGLSKEEREILDCEADAFAAEFLAPVPILRRLGVKTPLEIQKTCGLSAAAAQNRLKQMSMRKKWHGSTELLLLKQFQPFISQKTN